MADNAPPAGASAAHPSNYFEQRQLRRGAAGWLLLVGLGVAYVISGDYAGWNFGLKTGGWGGLLVASALMATMYTCMCFALAELATLAPTAGGGYGFARRAFGPWGGFLCGLMNRSDPRRWRSSPAHGSASLRARRRDRAARRPRGSRRG